MSYLNIISPKRNKRLQTGWEGFFPYYAGFPQVFARELLVTVALPPDAIVLDPWNGSGTTTYAASALGLRSIGVDLNPVMIIVARARLLASSESDHLRPLAASILSHMRAHTSMLATTDALLTWFQPKTAALIRTIEQNIRSNLIGTLTKSEDGIHLDRISGTAATLYVALFATCRKLVAEFQSSNPTWLRKPKNEEGRVCASRATLVRLFSQNVRGMAEALVAQEESDLLRGPIPERGHSSISLADTTAMRLPSSSVDFVLTSPPYCTRIDYTAATRIELAVLEPLLTTTASTLGQQMIGSTRVPSDPISADPSWGPTCARFLDALQNHSSKASRSYYLPTHLDYFSKMSRSLCRITDSLKPGGQAILVVQDSYYKDVHNDVPTIISEIGARVGLALRRREDFRLSRSMSDVHPGRKNYNRPLGATESVLCFAKE